MTEPVITATPTILSGLTICWQRDADSPVILTASRCAVMTHGSVIVDDDLRRWMTDAGRARDLLAAGRESEARAMVTRPAGAETARIPENISERSRT